MRPVSKAVPDLFLTRASLKQCIHVTGGHQLVLPPAEEQDGRLRRDTPNRHARGPVLACKRKQRPSVSDVEVYTENCMPKKVGALTAQECERPDGRKNMWDKFRNAQETAYPDTMREKAKRGCVNTWLPDKVN